MLPVRLVPRLPALAGALRWRHDKLALALDLCVVWVRGLSACVDICRGSREWGGRTQTPVADEVKQVNTHPIIEAPALTISSPYHH